MNERKVGVVGKQDRISFKFLISMAMIYGLSSAFTDMAIDLTSHPADLASLFYLLTPIAVAITINFVFYLLTTFLLFVLIKRFKTLSFSAFATSVAISLYMIVVMRAITHYSSLPLLALVIRLCFVALLCLLAGIGVYAAVKASQSKSMDSGVHLLSMSSAFPLLAGYLVIFVWFYEFRIHGTGATLLIASLAIILSILTVIFFILKPSLVGLRVLAILTILILLSPIAFLVQQNKSFAGKSEPHKIKHIILLTVDTLRRDALSCYGVDYLNTEHIDQLARNGILFTKAVASAPWTKPSFASIMTGLSPYVHQAIHRTSKLADNFTTIAEYMQSAGYQTAAIGINPVLLKYANFSQGFNEYKFYPKYFGYSLGVGFLRKYLKRYFLEKATTSDLTRLAMEWIQRNRNNDFFLWIHYYDPHLPYSPPQKYVLMPELIKKYGRYFSRLKAIRGGYYVPTLKEREWIRELYEGEVLYVDDSIGEIFRTLKENGLWDESLIVFTSDHGEEFWEHGGYEHGHTLYNELIRVPLIIKLPEVEDVKNVKVENYVSGIDILPTILEICQVPYQQKYLSGRSLLPLWTKPISEEKPVYSTGTLYYENREAVIFDDYKYIHSLITDQEQLFILNKDPGEQHSVLSVQKEAHSKAKQLLQEEKQKAEKLKKYYHVKTETMKLDRNVINKLKSLGYMR